MAAVQAIVEDRFTVPRPFTAGSVTAEKHRGGDASAGRMRALLEEADELYAQSLAGVVFDQPYEGTAPAELHTTWNSMMALLSAEQVRAQEDRAQQKRSGVKVRIPKPPRTAEGRHRHQAGAGSSGHGPLGGLPGPPAPPPHPEGGFGDGAPGPSRAGARLGGRGRPTSEGVTMLHQLDAHTDLHLVARQAEAAPAERGATTTKKAVAGAGGASIGPIPRPLAAQAALDALSRPPRSPRDPPPPHQSHRPASRGGGAAATSLLRTQLGAAAPPAPPSGAPLGGGSVAMRISSFQCAREAGAPTKRPPRASAAPPLRPAHGGRFLDGRPHHSSAPAPASAGSPGPASAAAAALAADPVAAAPSSSHRAAPSPAMAASNPPQIVPLSARTFAPPPQPPPPPLTHPPSSAVPHSEPHPPPAGAPIVAPPYASLAPSPAKHAVLAARRPSIIDALAELPPAPPPRHATAAAASARLPAPPPSAASPRAPRTARIPSAAERAWGERRPLSGGVEQRRVGATTHLFASPRAVRPPRTPAAARPDPPSPEAAAVVVASHSHHYGRAAEGARASKPRKRDKWAL